MLEELLLLSYRALENISQVINNNMEILHENQFLFTGFTDGNLKQQEFFGIHGCFPTFRNQQSGMLVRIF